MNKNNSGYMKNVSLLPRLLILAIVLSFVLLTSCKTLPDDLEDIQHPSTATAETTQYKEIKPASESFTLGFHKKDVLHPYKLTTEYNYRLTTLLYDGLVGLDDNLTAVMMIASSIEYANKVYTAKINDKAKFSDGSLITSEDVVYSFNQAKNSAYYSSYLASIISATADGDKSVKFNSTASAPNANAAFAFPIIKNGSGDTPLGSGRYYFTDKDETKLLLNKNLNHRKFAPIIETITLVDLVDEDAVLLALASGEISFSYDDLSKGESVHTGVPIINSPLNYMVYLGLNYKKEVFSNEKVRSAMSYAISRQEIVSSAYASRALAATLPFHAKWSGASELTGFSVNENIAVSVAQLDKAGYNNKSALNFKIIIPEGNSFKLAAANSLKNQLLKSYVKVEVSSLPFAEYEKKLKSGDFDAYIGEISLPPTLSLDAFLNSGGAVSYGINTDGIAAKAYKSFCAGDKTIDEFIVAFMSDCPFIPLCYRMGQASFIRQVSGVNPATYDPFYDFELWKFDLS